MDDALKLMEFLAKSPFGSLALVVVALLLGWLVPGYVAKEKDRRIMAMDVELRRYIRLSRHVRGKRR